MHRRVFVLDDHMCPVPVDVPGEMYLEGPGVATGYRQQPGLTAEKFVDWSHGDEKEMLRIYRTGDLGRWRGGGRLDFLGRVDFQVKIRGLRVELGEIEAVIGRVEGVREVVVVACRSPIFILCLGASSFE